MEATARIAGLPLDQEILVLLQALEGETLKTDAEIRAATRAADEAKAAGR